MLQQFRIGSSKSWWLLVIHRRCTDFFRIPKWWGSTQCYDGPFSMCCTTLDTLKRSIKSYAPPGNCTSNWAKGPKSSTHFSKSMYIHYTSSRKNLLPRQEKFQQGQKGESTSWVGVCTSLRSLHLEEIPCKNQVSFTITDLVLLSHFVLLLLLYM